MSRGSRILGVNMANCYCLLSLRAKSWREEKRAEVPTRALFFLSAEEPSSQKGLWTSLASQGGGGTL